MLMAMSRHLNRATMGKTNQTKKNQNLLGFQVKQWQSQQFCTFYQATLVDGGKAVSMCVATVTVTLKLGSRLFSTVQIKGTATSASTVIL